MMPPGCAGSTDRRRTPRVRIRGRLPASFLTTSIPAAIRNISLGGILVESVEPFRAGSVYQLRMTADGDDADTWPLLTVTCVYCEPEILPDGSTSFLAGFAFAGGLDVSAGGLVYDLVDKATSMSGF
jgi:hypothetical protein